MDKSTNRTAAIEIVERRPAASCDPTATGLGSTVKPNELRIDGVPYWCSTKDNITMRAEPDGMVAVTVTLLARSVYVAQEPIDG